MEGEKRNGLLVLPTPTENEILLELGGTRNYQLWNKWDLYEYLLKSDKPINFDIEDFPMTQSELNEHSKKIK